MLFERPTPGNRATVVQLRFTGSGHRRPDDHPGEIEELARSAALAQVATVSGSRERPHPRWFVGVGKLDELAATVRETATDVVVFDHELTPAQARNVEERIECRVLTRTELILHIFADRARTYEGKLQVELAQLTHAQTRLVRGWTHLEPANRVGGGGGRGAGGRIGGAAQRGTGETQLELDQRMLAGRLRQVRRRLAGRAPRARPKPSSARPSRCADSRSRGLHQRRQKHLVQRLDGQRRPSREPPVRHAGSHHAALAGVNAEVVVADTVGFIRALPIALVEAFKATLEEVAEADLVLHVIDIAATDAEARRADVHTVLAEIGAADVPVLEVLNKTDLLASPEPTPWRAGRSSARKRLDGRRRGCAEGSHRHAASAKTP